MHSTQRQRRWRGGGGQGPSLAALSLAASSIAENSASGTLVGAIQGKTGGSTLSLAIDAGGRFAILSGNLVAGATSTDYETATSHSVTIRETRAGSPNSPRDTVLTITVTNVFEQPSLAALTLSASSIAENSAAGTVVGAVQGKTAGSTLSLTVDAGGRFALSGGNLVAGSSATDYETATSLSVTIRETLADSANSPRDTVLTINVTNVFEQPNLAALALDAASFTIGTPASGNITGAVAGQSVAAANLPAGLTIDGAARTWAYDGSGSAGTTTIAWTGTLADSANSPFSNNQDVTISASATNRLLADNSDLLTADNGDYLAYA